jgi:type I restriction enzyme S subunit
VGLFKTKTKQLYYPFLTQFVFSVEFEKQLDSVLVAGAQPNISSSNIENFEFPFPSLEEQTKIANFLSAIDDKINLCQAQIEKTEIYKKGLLQKMFV